MASPCEIHAATNDQLTAAAMLDKVAAEARRIEAKFSRYRADSVVGRINSAAGERVAVDEETAKLFDYADELYRISDGRFDITSGILRRAWTFDGGRRLPHAKAIRRALARVGWHRVEWKRPYIQLEPGMEIDLGGIGKEYAVDTAAALVRTMAPSLMINFGGDLIARGTRSSANAWRVAIDDPAAPGQALVQIELKQGAIATSGDAHRYVISKGKRFGHILDPRTGWPVDEAPRSVTVMASTCTHAGMLATLAMLQGSLAESFLDQQDLKYWCIR